MHISPGVIPCFDCAGPDAEKWSLLGSEVEITDSRQLHDGRYHLKVRVVRRFRVIQKWDLDGYRVARVDFIVDNDDDAPIDPPLAFQLNALSSAEDLKGKVNIESCTMSTATSMVRCLPCPAAPLRHTGIRHRSRGPSRTHE